MHQILGRMPITWIYIYICACPFNRLMISMPSNLPDKTEICQFNVMFIRLAVIYKIDNPSQSAHPTLMVLWMQLLATKLTSAAAVFDTDNDLDRIPTFKVSYPAAGTCR